VTHSTIRILVVDDHAIVREGLRTVLSDEPDMEIAGEAATGEDGVSLASKTHPDVILMDLVMPGLDGIEATRRIRAASPHSQIIVLTSFADDQRVHDAIQAGAIGYLLKDVMRSELAQAIRNAAVGKPTLHPQAQQFLMQQVVNPPNLTAHASLTARELDVMRLIAIGRSNKEIARALHLTEGTVKGYVSTILGKLGVADRTQAALYAVKHGLVSK
jgi:NarL family two-component system response regulator LiaR